MSAIVFKPECVDSAFQSHITPDLLEQIAMALSVSTSGSQFLYFKHGTKNKDVNYDKKHSSVKTI